MYRLGIAAGEKRRRADGLLADVGLEGLGSRRPGELSGGQRQRVALARALASDPDFLLLDEPFSALDRGTRRRMQEELVSLVRRRGLPALMVTHDTEEAVLTADRIIILSGEPARISGELIVDLPRPRRAADAKFIVQRDILHQEMAGSMEYVI
jgi:ABC-type nitrate/sulfonate/bicarbonate transport system ATPase subunit